MVCQQYCESVVLLFVAAPASEPDSGPPTAPARDPIKPVDQQMQDSGPPTASARDPIQPVDQEMQDILFKNMHYWSSMSSFPAPAGTRYAYSRCIYQLGAVFESYICILLLRLTLGQYIRVVR